MTKKELMAILDNQLPAGWRCKNVFYTRFSGREYEGGAYIMGITVVDKAILLTTLMAWFRLDDIDLNKHYIFIKQCDRTGGWEVRMKNK